MLKTLKKINISKCRYAIITYLFLIDTKNLPKNQKIVEKNHKKPHYFGKFL